MMHAHIYPYTRMQDMETHTLTHAYYIHDIRIQNRDEHTDSQTHICTSPTYVLFPRTCWDVAERWTQFVQGPDCKVVEQLQSWGTVQCSGGMSWCSRYNTRVVSVLV